MTDNPPKDEPGAQERFERGIANALRMPPKSHAPVKKPGVKRPPKKAATHIGTIVCHSPI